MVMYKKDSVKKKKKKKKQKNYLFNKIFNVNILE